MEMFTIRIASSLLSRSTKVHLFMFRVDMFHGCCDLFTSASYSFVLSTKIGPAKPRRTLLVISSTHPRRPFPESRDASTRGEATLRPARLRRTCKGLTVHSQLIPSAAHDQIEPCAYEKKPQRHDTIEIKNSDANASKCWWHAPTRPLACVCEGCLERGSPP